MLSSVPHPLVAPEEEILRPSIEEWLTAVEHPPRPAVSPPPSPSPPAPRRHGARRVLPSSPPLFDWLDHRFSPGEATLWVGPPSVTEPLLELVYAGSVYAGGRVSLLEGTNRFHPYRVGETGRALGLDPEHLLSRVRLARAFTAYQMVALVDAWSQEARRRRPTLLVAHEPSTLFLTDEVPEEERAPLLRHVAVTLQAVARAAHCPLLISVAGGFSRFPGLKEHGPQWFDLVRMTPRGGGMQLEIVPRSPGQRGLEEYGEIARSEEVTTWAAPFRRTARRSRSG
ncbi:MAG: hypothetical protein L3K08_06365 [Thermoplasmata archaeon]|nr:hypothetical protein [Thermoplasmata archaeon]